MKCIKTLIAFCNKSHGGKSGDKLVKTPIVIFRAVILKVDERTFDRWKKQYGSQEPGQAREPKQLQEENARPKKPVAGLSLDEAILQDGPPLKQFHPIARA